MSSVLESGFSKWIQMSFISYFALCSQCAVSALVQLQLFHSNTEQVGFVRDIEHI